MSTKTVKKETNLCEIRNLCAWTLYFKRQLAPGDISLEPPGSYSDYLEIEELQAQIRARNKFFTGEDGRGAHARILIVDDDVRRSVLGEASDDAIVLTKNAVAELLGINDRDAFSARLGALVVTTAEHKMIFPLAMQCGLDDLAGWKRIFIESVAKAF